MDAGDLYGMEFRRCLIEADVSGIMKLHAHVNPHLPQLEPRDALCALHMARCDAKEIPLKLKTWSRAWLAEQTFQKIDGKWVHGIPKGSAVFEAVGIISGPPSPGSPQRPFNRKITRVMTDALCEGLERGITEPPMQKELMMKARAKVRFRARVD